jgi:hypothetical protein
VHILQIKSPACRVIYFSKNAKKFPKFGYLLCDVFTISRLKTSKKPRGYRIFERISFQFTLVMILQIDLKSLRTVTLWRKKYKKSLQLSVIFLIFPQKTF